MKLNRLLLAAPLFLSFFCAANFCAAQNSSQPQTPEASSPAPAAQPAQTPKQSQDQDKNEKDKNNGNKEATTEGTSKDRLFFALPNFLTVDANGRIIPLTTGQKFKVVAEGSFDPVQIVWYAALSAVSQAQDSEPGFGQGWAAYGKRYGAYAADGTIENFFVGAIMPSLLRQDPRFFPKPQGTFMNRTEYAVSRIFVTRADSGRSQFNYSEIFGAGLASFISTYAYHPHPGYHPEPGVKVPYIASDRTWKNATSVWGSQVGYDTITYVVKEFWPDIRRKLVKNHSHQE